MLFAVVLAGFVFAEPQLEENLLPTLFYGAVALLAAQAVRSVLRFNDTFDTVISSILAVVLVPAVGLVVVLFGAPFGYFLQTLLASAHISLLALQPLISAHGLDSDYWLKAASLQLPFTDLYGGSVGTAVGAWLGAIPIVLDWDRPWQEWPITIVVGAYLGCIVGTVFGSLVGGADEKPKSVLLKPSRNRAKPSTKTPQSRKTR